MGGERDTTLEAKGKGDAAGVSGSVGGRGGARIRIHDAAGHVHFHDDKAKLKASVPASEWWKAWEKLRTQPGRWEWVDSDNKTFLTVITEVSQANVDAVITLESAAIGTNYHELNKFTKRK